MSLVPNHSAESARRKANISKLFIAVASVLATFNIEKAIGPDGNPIMSHECYIPSTVRYDSIAAVALQRLVYLTERVTRTVMMQNNSEV